jgi:hypothetical protein
MAESTNLSTSSGAPILKRRGTVAASTSVTGSLKARCGVRTYRIESDCFDAASSPRLGRCRDGRALTAAEPAQRIGPQFKTAYRLIASLATEISIGLLGKTLFWFFT